MKKQTQYNNKILTIETPTSTKHWNIVRDNMKASKSRQYKYALKIDAMTRAVTFIAMA